MAHLRPLADQVNHALEAEDQGTPGAHDELVRSVEKLQIAALGPTEYLLRLRYAPIQNASIVLAGESGMLQAVARREGATVTAAEISKETGTSDMFVKRIMRMLTLLDICEESSQSTYKSNTITQTLNNPGYLGAMNFISSPTMKNLGNARNFFKEKGFPMFGPPSSFQYAHGQSLWEYFRDHPESKQDFDLYMSAASSDKLAYWFDTYPAASHLQQLSRSDDEAVAIVDIAGGRGHDLRSFSSRYPELPGRLVLEDLPETFKTEGYVPSQGIEVQPYDFFTPQPIKGAQFYLFHRVLHDWPNRECHQILSNTVQAMSRDSRLLIQDIVIPNTNASHHAVYMDVLMMFNVAGVERSAEEWQGLVEGVGLEIVNIWPSEQEPVIETRLKQ
ncbi:MAG: hypothetical protein M1831_000621 [Alyxoria varia]|nr:MAG: hypothetical protein M1831_000621 [Alyxoria varia]